VDPRALGASDWSQIAHALTALYLFVALAVNAALALLLGVGILPSLVHSLHAPADVLRWRRVLVPVGLVSLALMLLTLAQAIGLAVGSIEQIFPRLAI
jgi:predicted ferric reductase